MLSLETIMKRYFSCSGQTVHRSFHSDIDEYPELAGLKDKANDMQLIRMMNFIDTLTVNEVSKDHIQNIIDGWEILIDETNREITPEYIGFYSLAVRHEQGLNSGSNKHLELARVFANGFNNGIEPRDVLKGSLV